MTTLSTTWGQLRAWFSVDQGEPAPTSRMDPWYAGFVVLVTALSVVAVARYAPVATIDAPLWGLALLVPLATVAGFMSRLGDGDDAQIDHASIFTDLGAIVYGPLWGFTLAGGAYALSQFPQRRRMGGIDQYALGTANMGASSMVSGLAFAAAHGSGISIVFAVPLAMFTGSICNLIINAGWCLAGGRDFASLVSAMSHNLIPMLILSVYVALGAASASTSPLLFIGLLSPLILSRLSQHAERELQQAHQTLVIDDLTGIFNRRHFWSELSLHLSELDREAGAVGVVMGDIDSFKQLNDTFGHLEGDRALIATAHALRDACPEGVVMRYGGEEFGMVVPDANLDQLVAIAERARLAAKEALVPWGTTISLGVAIERSAPGRSVCDPHDLANRADRALYASKHAGKDRVTVAPQPDEQDHDLRAA